MSWLGRRLAANPAVRAFIAREVVQVARRRREAVETLAAVARDGERMKLWMGLRRRAEQKPGERGHGNDSGVLRRAVEVVFVEPGQIDHMRRTGTGPTPKFREAIQRAEQRRRATMSTDLRFL